MGPDVLDFQEIDRSRIALAGGKGAHLGELSRLDGINVPPGFCVTTEAFRQVLDQAPATLDRIERLYRLSADEPEAIRALSAEIRRDLAEIAIPAELGAAIEASLAKLGSEAAYAVRSSATAEDSPAASFAGQHDSFLGVVGPAAILAHVRRCWASLFSERAVIYRLRNRIDPRQVHMAVVVQRMVFPQAAGVLFTADPVSGNRKVAAVEAVAGLGEALVSGLTNADTCKVRNGEIVFGSLAGPKGPPALTDTQVLRLVELGRRIEAHFGRPQDIEFCLAGDDFQIVQSRPITTLFPVPDAGDDANRVYVSVGHQQMMTDPMKPLGLSFWNLTTPRPMAEAGGRLFVDVTQALASPASRASLLEVFGKGDPRVRDAVQTLLDRGDFLPALAESPGAAPPAAAPAPPIETDPAIVAGLIGRTQESIATLKREIRTQSGTALFDFILADLAELKRLLFDPLNMRIILAAMDATWWLNEQMEAWLGEKKAADTLTLSVPNNVTSEMGLELLEVADVIRPHAEVVAFLKQADNDAFLDELPRLPGGQEASEAIRGWLDRYGMRGVGEIDITRPRFSERPGTLLPILLGNVENAEPGAAERRFEQGKQRAGQKEQELLARLRALPDGEAKAEETQAKIDLVRTFIGYREYPKYGKVCRYSIYKEALLAEAGRLVEAGVLREQEDIFYLRFEELHEVVRGQQVDEGLLRERKEAFESYRDLKPPRVLTSEGEALNGAYRRDDLPEGALAGLAVSAGIVEGRARVILDLADAQLEPGDILVTAYTDPSWTPLFVGIQGLVTEVGGVMTHGSVIAREFGLPAVVGVANATRRIHDGQRIRLNGTDGYVEILEAQDSEASISA